MAHKLVVLSDIWGAKKGQWITSYLGYLQQYYDITYYDIQKLANIDMPLCTEDNLKKTFELGGANTATSHLLKKETAPAHYLAFSLGADIAWKAALEGLPALSLTLVSGNEISFDKPIPNVPIKLAYGEKDTCIPCKDVVGGFGMDMEVFPKFGHQLYSDEKIIGALCLELLHKATRKQRVKKQLLAS